ncbi:MAG: glycerol-phosphatase [Frankiales bacterium]|jgi:HAD superfamily hydrolase (TIGR01457 family)|nr:glycerol-phosphatase [Frankiales bacterium]
MTVAPPPAGIDDDGSPGHAADAPLSTRYDVALLDLDGVVYRGADPVPGAPEALTAARAAGMRLAFVTNNASRTPQQIVAHLGQLGVPARADEVVTSAHAAAALAAERLGPGGRVFVVGSDGLRDAVAGAGLVLVGSYDAVPAPQLVVQGFSPDLRYEDLAQAALAIAAGADWVATNTDATIPTSRGIQPGNGTLVAAVAAAAGRQPVVAGKPERALVDEAVRRSGAGRPLVVGDRLDTDIEGAVRADLDSLLVLTGVSTVADLLAADPGARPTYLGMGLAALGAPQLPLADFGTLPAQRRTGWQAETWSGSLRLTRSGAGPAHPLDALRTLVVAAWAGLDAAEPVTSVLVDAALERSLLALGVPPGLLRLTAPDPGSSTLAGEARAGR